MNCNFLNINLDIIKKRFPALYRNLAATRANDDYAASEPSKTGSLLPILKNGHSLHSRYNPEREAEKLFSGGENFVLFCGLGSGVHIDFFLRTFKGQHCACTEASYPALKSLLEKIDFSHLLLDSNFNLLPPVKDKNFPQALLQTYIPQLHGNFTVTILAAWQAFYPDAAKQCKIIINEALENLKADLSTQARFGKIWMRNIMQNLKTASKISLSLPNPEAEKKALILGAGPSLEQRLYGIAKKRNKYVLFCSDTAFPVLIERGIIPEFFIGIDAQAVSYTHSFKPFPKTTVAVFDLCASPLAVRQFIENGNPILFAAGGHPFAQYAAAFSPFPHWETKSGTVALAAKSGACALGFTAIEYAGLDFAYEGGKAYANGTYLSKQFSKTATKTLPLETQFIDLMFRTPIETIKKHGSITYTTALLKSYHGFFTENVIKAPRWQKRDAVSFPYKAFIERLKKDIKTENPMLKTAFLPYFTYISQKKAENKGKFPEMKLVLSEILGYT